MTITNLERVVDQLRRYGEGFEDGAFDAQLSMAKEIMIVAQHIYCPVSTPEAAAKYKPPRSPGALRDSARLSAELREIHTSSVDIQFGNNVAWYAAIVHERLDVHHTPPTQAKYLERAAHERAPEFTLRVGEGAVAAAKARSGAG